LYIINFITDEKGKHLSGLMDKSMDIPFVDFYYNAFMLGLEFIILNACSNVGIMPTRIFNYRFLCNDFK